MWGDGRPFEPSGVFPQMFHTSARALRGLQSRDVYPQDHNSPFLTSTFRRPLAPFRILLPPFQNRHSGPNFVRMHGAPINPRNFSFRIFNCFSSNNTDRQVGVGFRISFSKQFVLAEGPSPIWSFGLKGLSTTPLPRPTSHLETSFHRLFQHHRVVHDRKISRFHDDNLGSKGNSIGRFRIFSNFPLLGTKSPLRFPDVCLWINPPSLDREPDLRSDISNAS